MLKKRRNFTELRGDIVEKYYYDITNPDAAYNWLYSVLDMKQGDLIEDYIFKCGNDFEIFFENHIEEIKRIDINELELVAVHVTSNDDDCSSIKKYGLRNLKIVLTENTELKRFLLGEQIEFDVDNKKMVVHGIEYELDYQKYLDMKDKTAREKDLESIARKLYYDFQVNGFFFNRDIFDYGTGIHKHPEFLLTLSGFGIETKDIDYKWSKMNQGYVIKYKSHVADFEYYTFYEGGVEEYLNDAQNDRIKLRHWLISHAIDGCFSNLASEVFAYMKPNIVITPDRILEYVSVEEWRENVSKYFE